MVDTLSAGRSDRVSPSVAVGQWLADKYVVEQLLGSGGMGYVVAARHAELGELRAIKLMHPAATRDPELLERFLREARAAVRLRSAHVVRIYDVGRLGDGQPFVVMEHLEGSDLRALLRRRGPLPIAEAVGYVVQACEAVAEAHAHGIVHRDLKPGNLFVTRTLDGPSVKVLDFGVAKLTSALARGGVSEMTTTSTSLGTPSYMSPEQMRSSRQVDGRSDLWALGVILYQLLTGRVPFRGDSVTALCAAVLQDAPVEPKRLRSELPAELESTVLRCLEKRPEDRYGSVRELAAALAPHAGPWVEATVRRIAQIGPPAAIGTEGSSPSLGSKSLAQGSAAALEMKTWALAEPVGALAEPVGALAEPVGPLPAGSDRTMERADPSEARSLAPEAATASAWWAPPAGRPRRAWGLALAGLLVGAGVLLLAAALVTLGPGRSEPSAAAPGPAETLHTPQTPTLEAKQADGADRIADPARTALETAAPELEPDEPPDSSPPLSALPGASSGKPASLPTRPPGPPPSSTTASPTSADPFGDSRR